MTEEKRVPYWRRVVSGPSMGIEVERLCAMEAVPVYVVRALLKERDDWRQNYWDRTAEEGRLRAALEKAAETFEDFEKGLKLLSRPLLAEACQIAGTAAREALRGEESRDG